MKLLSNTIKILSVLVILICTTLFGFRVYAWNNETIQAAALVPSNGRLVETELGTMHITEWGKGNSKTVVTTHGMAAWGGLWWQVGKALADEGYHVIAVDLPPFGMSGREDVVFTRSAEAMKLNALVTALNLKEFFLLGHSYGGGAALEMAVRYPQNLRGVILASPVIDLASDGEPKLRPLPGYMKYPHLLEYAVSATITNPFLTDILIKQFTHRDDSVKQAHIDVLQRPMKRFGNTKAMVAWLQQFMVGDPGALSRRPEQVSALSVPLTLIWGDKDQITPLAEGEAFAELTKPLAFHQLKDVGHMPQIEATEAFIAHTIDSLTQMDALAKETPVGVTPENPGKLEISDWGLKNGIDSTN